MAFNLYFAGSSISGLDDYLMYKDTCRLFSYINDKKNIETWKDFGYGPNLLIDSGAFSVFTVGAKVDIDEYIQYINDRCTIANFIELDVIPPANGTIQQIKKCCDDTWNNYVYMKQRITNKCTLLPVFHFGEPIEALERILNTKVNGELPEYICVGGLVKTNASYDLQKQYFNHIFSVIKHSNNPNIKVHALGLTILTVLEQFPFYSSDSTTWIQSGINGRILTKTGYIAVSDRQKHTKQHLLHYPELLKKQILNDIANRGYDINKLMADYKERLRYNIDYLQEWANNYVYKGPTSFTENILF